MNCEDYRNNLVARIRDELSSRKKTEMDAHAQVCPKCKREWMNTQVAMDLAAMTSEKPLRDLAHAFLSEALIRDASDLHFERRSDTLNVRCRIDGVMTDLSDAVRRGSAEYPELLAILDSMSMGSARALIARLKDMAGVDPAESDIPQKGRISVAMPDKDGPGTRLYSLPISFMPVDGGGREEDAVCRIIPKQSPFALEALGMSDRLRAAIDRMISQPMGVVLVGGPSGSGKTTVAHVLAQHLASPDKKTVTVEDPVFYKMENVTQIEVAEHKGLSASALLSRVIWLDPDVIVAPEVRDGEVARRVAELANEGTLVIAPIHADDAAEALWEFAHMPTDRPLPYSVAVGATNQRLVRRICPDCREEYTPSERALRSLFLDASSMQFGHGAGCEKCRNTGYLGRAQIMETLELTLELADSLAASGEQKDFFARARKATSPTLVEDGRRLVLEGISTAEEVCRVLSLPR